MRTENMKKYHLDEIIGRLIEKEAGLFLNLAAYSTVTENNADSCAVGCHRFL